MRLITRNDAPLAVALVTATIVIFQQPLRYAFDFAHDMQDRYHVDLIPALTILTGVFLFHQSRKRHEAKADAREAAAEAAQARLRSAELEQLVRIGEALANALDPGTLQAALVRHLPAFAHDRACWMLLWDGSAWNSFLPTGEPASSESLENVQMIAARAMEHWSSADARGEGVVDGTTLCFPLLAAGTPVGVLGLREGSTIGVAERRALGAAASVIAIAIRNVQLLVATQEASVRDDLTGCYTRAHGIDSIDHSMRLARRTGLPLAVIMFDIDHFKTINDELGHLRGDELLRGVGEMLTRVLRSTDIACRYGGDEFLVMCPDTPLLGAQQVAETLRREISGIVVGVHATTRQATGSFGVAASLPGEIDPEALIERADAALYLAKRAGRNCFRVAAHAQLPTGRNETSLAG